MNLASFVKKPSAKRLFSLLVGFIILTALSFSFTTQVFKKKSRQYFEDRNEIVWELKLPVKAVAITFDDGPSPSFTDQILVLLKKHQAKATFFVSGRQAVLFPEVIQRIDQAGHEIGNHLYHHIPIPGLTGKQLYQELAKNHYLIEKITGKKIGLFRPINGYYDEKVVWIAHSLNYQIILWSLDSRDWSGKSGTQIAGNILQEIKPGQIILFHDQGGDRSNTIDALSIILPKLYTQGYRFLTVSDLLKFHHKNDASFHDLQ